MKRVILFLAVISIFLACGNGEEVINDIKDQQEQQEQESEEQEEQQTPYITELLAGTESKSWHITSFTPEDEDCPNDEEWRLDNTWIFYSDGTFEYDHGTVTEGENCGDFVNIIGTWELTNGESGLQVVGLYEKGNPDNSFEFTIVDGDIKNLTEESFTVIQVDPDTDVEYTSTYAVRK